MVGSDSDLKRFKDQRGQVPLINDKIAYKNRIFYVIGIQRDRGCVYLSLSNDPYPRKSKYPSATLNDYRFKDEALILNEYNEWLYGVDR